MGREPGEVVSSMSSLAQQMVAAVASRESNFSLSSSQLRSLFSQSLRRGESYVRADDDDDDDDVTCVEYV